MKIDLKKNKETFDSMFKFYKKGAGKNQYFLGKGHPLFKPYSRSVEKKEKYFKIHLTNPGNCSFRKKDYDTNSRKVRILPNKASILPDFCLIFFT